MSRIPTIDLGLLLMGLALGTILGRAWEKWASGAIDIQEEAYKIGYNDGVDQLYGRKYMIPYQRKKP